MVSLISRRRKCHQWAEANMAQIVTSRAPESYMLSL